MTLRIEMYYFIDIDMYITDSLHFADGLVKRLEELEKTAELYKGKE